MTEDEMIRQHHQLNGNEFEQYLEDCGGQRRLACCSPWGCKELDTTQQQNNKGIKTFRMKGLYCENFKMLMKDIEDDAKSKRYSVVLDYKK